MSVQATGPVVAGARIYNQTGATVRESQGQLMPGIPAGFAIGPGEGTDVPGVLQPGTGDFRSNFGLVETSGDGARVEVARSTPLAIAGRIATTDVALSILAHNADLHPGLPSPVGASFLYAELVQGR